jgi:hypothetical protein
MLEFVFTVNLSFLGSRLHPITIPRGRVDYGDLQAEGLSRGSFTIHCPDGRTLPGTMYSGVAGYGPYFQLKADGYSRDPLFDVRYGTRLLVRLEHHEDGSHAYLSVESPRHATQRWAAPEVGPGRAFDPPDLPPDC